MTHYIITPSQSIAAGYFYYSELKNDLRPVISVFAFVILSECLEVLTQFAPPPAQGRKPIESEEREGERERRKKHDLVWY